MAAAAKEGQLTLFQAIQKMKWRDSKVLVSRENKVDQTFEMRSRTLGYLVSDEGVYNNKENWQVIDRQVYRLNSDNKCSLIEDESGKNILHHAFETKDILTIQFFVSLVLDIKKNEENFSAINWSDYGKSIGVEVVIDEADSSEFTLRSFSTSALAYPIVGVFSELLDSPKAAKNSECKVEILHPGK